MDAGEAGDVFYVWGRRGTWRRRTLRLGFSGCHFVVCGWKLWFGKGDGSLVQIPVCLDICSSINHLKGSVDVIIAIELKTISFTASTTNIKKSDEMQAKKMTAIRAL
jgi:hypothetical protein